MTMQRAAANSSIVLFAESAHGHSLNRLTRRSSMNPLAEPGLQATFIATMLLCVCALHIRYADPGAIFFEAKKVHWT